MCVARIYWRGYIICQKPINPITSDSKSDACLLIKKKKTKKNKENDQRFLSVLCLLSFNV